MHFNRTYLTVVTCILLTCSQLLLGVHAQTLPELSLTLDAKIDSKDKFVELYWPKAKGKLEEALPPLPARNATEGGRSC